ncbi:UNVERIFIED_CONTAM: hypothetical protein PYX00_001459 [Menopon gallinae]|uniref:Puratrophin-1 n=1 Tax=Menopon gallinae TaxID=328185 RepID=A0AAW2IEY1_9NEOP
MGARWRVYSLSERRDRSRKESVVRSSSFGFKWKRNGDSERRCRLLAVRPVEDEGPGRTTRRCRQVADTCHDRDGLISRHLDKGNDLVDEIGQTPSSEEMSSGANGASGLRDLAKSLKFHLKGFGEKLEDTRERLEDTSRCFYLLDKTYEWSLDTSRYVNRIKTDEEVSEEMARQLLNNIEQRLSNHPPLSDAHFAELSNLAKKLQSEKLIEQCKLAQSRYQEAFEIVQNTQSRLLQIVNANAEEAPVSPFVVNWNMIMSRIPGGGTFNIGRRRSLASFPYIYKCSHHAAGHDCACDPSVTRDPSKKVSQCQCSCGTLMKPLTDIRESPEDLPHQKVSDWEYNGSRSAMKRHLRRTSTWQYPAESFDDQDNNSNKSSSHSGESDNKDLDEQEVALNAPSMPVSVSVNSHLYCHASNLSLNLAAQGEQVRDAKTQKTLLLIMREMIQTERDYVASLEYVIENYIPQLLREDIPQALRGQRNVVFGNIEKIYEFHSQHFLQELESCEKNPLSVGQCFLKYEKKFYLYALYNKNKPKSDSLMAEYGSNFFKTKQMELGDKMDLASYLLKPVQRMGKYALLLQQLMKALGERESSDLSAAEAMVRFQLRHGNDLLAMDSLRDCDVNLKEQGRLLRQNEFLVWQGKGKKCLRHVFLFEELILFSKARRFPDRKNLDIYIYKNSIKTTDIGLTAKIGDSPTKFEIWFRKRKPNDTFTLQSMSEEVKQAWTEELSGILWKQALKNREMRLQEMSSMGIGNKPCLDIRPSADQINDRSISVAQLKKTAPRFRNSIAVLSRDALSTNKRPHSIISVTSSSSSGGSTGSGSHVADSPRLPRSALHSQCSAESGIITDISLTSEEMEGRDSRWHLERSNSTVTSTSLDSSLSPVLSSDDISGFVASTYENDAAAES